MYVIGLQKNAETFHFKTNKKKNSKHGDTNFNQMRLIQTTYEKSKTTIKFIGILREGESKL